jgi:hypothetical protein
MSISKKGRRKITVGNQICFWYVAPDDDSAFNVLHIVSEDKCLILSCPLQTKTAYVISNGSVFQTKETDGTWNRYLLPFDIPDAITPGFVRKVIVWSMQTTDAIPVSWNGYDIPV